jgi:hypothetical protein
MLKEPMHHPVDHVKNARKDHRVRSAHAFLSVCSFQRVPENGATLFCVTTRGEKMRLLVSCEDVLYGYFICMTNLQDGFTQGVVCTLVC